VVGDLTADGAAEEKAAAWGEVEETAGQGSVEAEALADGESDGTEEAVLVEGEETACDVLVGLCQQWQEVREVFEVGRTARRMLGKRNILKTVLGLNVEARVRKHSDVGFPVRKPRSTAGVTSLGTKNQAITRPKKDMAAWTP
jgi:hypothetical protein